MRPGQGIQKCRRRRAAQAQQRWLDMAGKGVDTLRASWTKWCWSGRQTDSQWIVPAEERQRSSGSSIGLATFHRQISTHSRTGNEQRVMCSSLVLWNWMKPVCLYRVHLKRPGEFDDKRAWTTRARSVPTVLTDTVPAYAYCMAMGLWPRCGLRASGTNHNSEAVRESYTGVVPPLDGAVVAPLFNSTSPSSSLSACPFSDGFRRLSGCMHRICWTGYETAPFMQVASDIRPKRVHDALVVRSTSDWLSL
nr:hypothetical protein CFP56_70514 [Quercus suber]